MLLCVRSVKIEKLFIFLAQRTLGYLMKYFAYFRSQRRYTQQMIDVFQEIYN